MLFTKGADDADFVVVGHSTDLGKDKYFLASLHKHGINAALSGNGTSWHWFEDKLMGAKAALLQMSGNPLVMFADTTDVMFNCPAAEILDRFFKQSGADILIGGETQLWPEIDTYFDMKRERDFIEKTSAAFAKRRLVSSPRRNPRATARTECRTAGPTAGRGWGARRLCSITSTPSRGTW